LLTGMLAGVTERGPDSAGVAIYGDPTLTAGDPATGDVATVSLLDVTVAPDQVAAVVEARLGWSGRSSERVRAQRVGPVTVVSAQTRPDDLRTAAAAGFPQATLVGYGTDLAVLKAVGDPRGLAEA